MEHKFEIIFDFGNADFDEGLAGPTSSIFAEIIEALKNGKSSGGLWDNNGNSIGNWEARNHAERYRVCEGCSEMLTEADKSERRAYENGGTWYCITCQEDMQLHD